MAALPQKNTFIHFEMEDQEASLLRSASCPANFRARKIMGRSDSVSTHDAQLLEAKPRLTLPIPARSHTSCCNLSCEQMWCSNGSPCEGSRKRMCRTLRTEAECRERLAEVCTDEETTPTHSDDLPDDEQRSPTCHETSFEDISTDGDTPPHARHTSFFSDDEEANSLQKSVSLRWADLFEDEPM